MLEIASTIPEEMGQVNPEQQTKNLNTLAGQALVNPEIMKTLPTATQESIIKRVLDSLFRLTPTTELCGQSVTVLELAQKIPQLFSESSGLSYDVAKYLFDKADTLNVVGMISGSIDHFDAEDHDRILSTIILPYFKRLGYPDIATIHEIQMGHYKFLSPATVALLKKEGVDIPEYTVLDRNAALARIEAVFGNKDIPNKKDKIKDMIQQTRGWIQPYADHKAEIDAAENLDPQEKSILFNRIFGHLFLLRPAENPGDGLLRPAERDDSKLVRPVEENR